MYKLTFLLPLITIISSCSNDKIQIDFSESETHYPELIFSVSDFNESHFLTFLNKVEFLSNGNLIIKSAQNYELLEVSPYGELISVIGKQGRGPGEFVNINEFVVSPNDSIHIFDRNSGRQQIFAKDSENENWQLINTILIETINSDDEFILDYPIKIFPSDDGLFWTQFKNRPHFTDTTNQIYNTIIKTDQNLNPVGPELLIKQTENRPIHRDGGQVWTAGFSTVEKGFYVFLPEPENLIYIKNTDNRFQKFELNGAQILTEYLPFDELDITNEKNTILNNLARSYDSVRLSIVRSKLLDKMPYYDHVIYGDGNIWIQFYRNDEDDLNWGKYSLNGELEGVFYLSTDFQVLGINNNILYGTSQSDHTITLSGFRIESLD